MEPRDVASQVLLPPFVYVPTTSADDPTQRRVLMHTVEDGRTALYVYSAIDRLNRWYLTGNPWIVCDVAALQRIFNETPYDLLFVDIDAALSQGPGAGNE